MLPAAARMRRGAEFTAAVGGCRSGTRRLVVHWQPSDAPLHVGFVVGRGVGSAVTRNRVRRRLRHLVRDRLEALPATGLLVVRANAAAASATSQALRSDLDAALARTVSA